MKSGNEILVKGALSMYQSEPCRICGEEIRKEDLEDLIFVGYSSCDDSRAAHKECWESDKPESEWVYK